MFISQRMYTYNTISQTLHPSMRTFICEIQILIAFTMFEINKKK